MTLDHSGTMMRRGSSLPGRKGNDPINLRRANRKLSQFMTSGWIVWARGIGRDKGWGNDMPEIERRIVQDILPNAIGGVGRVDDIATLVSLIASPHADFLTGANLRVDWGSVQTVN